ncbi:MAG TPA: DUF3109 family protein [Thermoanaerobaculia bacterium]
MEARRQRVAIVADAVAEAAERADAVAGSLEEVRNALLDLGHDPEVIEFAGDPAPWLGALRDGGFDLVFNLCEGLGGQGSEEHLAAAAVELLGLPLTGARAFTLGLCLRKDVVNAHLRASGIAVPDWAVSRAGRPLAWRRYPAIVKPAAEDASLGIDAASVVRDAKELAAARERGHAAFERLLVQRYVEGRELTMAIVGEAVLPHSEIEWALPAGVPHIVSYAGKWDPESDSYLGTPARILDPGERRLASRLDRLARRVWAAVDGVGYGRVDARLDARGGLHVIDVNPNPDLSPGAGLARQAAAAGWSYRELVARIVAAALASQDGLSRARGASRAAAPAAPSAAPAPLAVVKPTRLAHLPELRIDPRLLAARFPAGCETGRCAGACCRTGVWLDPADRDRVLAHADLVRQAMDPGQPRDPRHWFACREKADPDFPSGRAVHTRVRDGRCVFLNGAGRCVLQKASQAAGNGLQLKPFFCTAFPVTLDHGVLTLDDDDFRAGHPCCEAAAEGPLTVFETCAMELRHVLGAAGVERLRQIAAPPRRSG